jgi:hypothetical protein
VAARIQGILAKYTHLKESASGALLSIGTTLPGYLLEEALIKSPKM